MEPACCLGNSASHWVAGSSLEEMQPAHTTELEILHTQLEIKLLPLIQSLIHPMQI